MQGDKLREACGIFGIYAPGEDVARLTFFGLYTLQHRGQESAGIATSDGEDIALHTSMGLVAQAFAEGDLARLRGRIAIGHTRYSTTGSSRIINAQPIALDSDIGPMALGHNGNLVNAQYLREILTEGGIRLSSSSDSEVIARLIACSPGADWLSRIQHTFPRLQGAFSLVMLTRDRLFGIRDSLGVRPLCVGRIDGGWVLASESCALDTVGAEFVREVEPGEIVVIDGNGVRSYRSETSRKRAMCVFEYIYFARPDSHINGRSIYQARRAMGHALAREHPVDADLVVGIPDSAIPAAIGYAQESGIPYSEGVIKSRYIGRTFIQPDQRIREMGVKLKFNPLPDVLQGKRVIVVDDSIVRGTTTGPIVNLLRRGGADEVHLRISSPPIRFPCHLGIDMARLNELIAARLTVSQIRQHIGADSLGYLSVGGRGEGWPRKA